MTENQGKPYFSETIIPRILHQDRILMRTEYLFAFLLIAINLIFGISTLTDYGESWDEARLYEYGDQSLNAYRALFNPDIPVDFGDDDLRYYGPAYFMGMSLLVNGVHAMFPTVAVIDLWHAGNFICLQFGVVCLYFLLRRFTSIVPALITTSLFSTQPLIWGHGFINPKDIPFMAFFTASVYFGLNMLDHFEKENFELRSLLKNPWFYVASVLLGFTISIRILGFAAAGIVLFYFAFNNFKKMLRLSYGYFGIALLVCFLTWPYLWSSPVTNFLQGIYAMLKFQWVGQVLFNGNYYLSNDLPRVYVPQLLVMQLTEPASILFALGALSHLSSRLRQKNQNLLILFLAWFIFPLAYILINGMNLYDNTRQLLFMFPGLFLMIAIGIEFLFGFVKPVWGRVSIAALILLPGAAGIMKFHPYEYAFYNFLTTTQTQIFRRYETDYWATSFKEASLFLNENAPANTQVIVWGPEQLIQRYAREDLNIKSFDDLTDKSYAAQSYYLVLTTRYDIDQSFFPDVQPVYAVKANDAVYAVVKYITP